VQALNNFSAQEIIKKLDLIPLPEEGGFYRETYRSTDLVLGNRAASTAIYYLITPEDFSAIHKISSDEVFHFYAGDTAEMLMIYPNGEHAIYPMGSNVMDGEISQLIVPKNVWQGLKLKEGGKWALLGTTVAPGFEFSEFVVGTRSEMNQSFPNLPNLKDVIFKYTR
jgi:uncharacterized protein